jgi:CheY-like chemotaxis protein
VTLQVRDDGMGMSETLLPHVFEAFVQGERKLDGAVGGLGIGLALVRNLVEMHGGVASAYSAGPGQGSTFTVILPLGLPEAAAAPEPAAPVVEGAGAAALPVLVVDDNRDGADFLADLLRSMGYAVTVAYDPAQALQEAARAMPAVAILDIGLPGMNGYELAEHMRRLPQGAAVVFVALTGYGQHDDKLRSRASGFAGHLVKPVGVDELQAVLLRLTTAGGRP